VGVVQTVDPTMSLAILFAHPDFRVSAMSADGSSFGIVQPHLAKTGTATPQSSYLASERWLLELRGVPFRSALKPGAVVYSSGLGGIYPKGIPVGVVLGEIKTAEAWARTYLLRPAVNPAVISSVMVLTPQRATSGLTNVWAEIGAVDTATRRIVAAGDSLARQAASAEAAARRAAIDSAVRVFRDSAGRDSATVADSIARVVPGAPVVPRAAPAAQTTRPSDSAAARARRAAARADSSRRDTSGVRP
jgi:rod shape-determining protein MreC